MTVGVGGFSAANCRSSTRTSSLRPASAKSAAAQSTPAYWSYVDYLHTHGQDVTGPDRDLKKAEQFYKKCLEIEPEYAPVYMNLAVVLSGNSKWEELEDLLRKALETAGVDRAAIFNE